MKNFHSTNLGTHIKTKKGYAFKSKWFCKDEGMSIVKVGNFTEDSINSEGLARISQSIAQNYNQYKILEGDVIIQTVGSWPSNPLSVVGKVIKVPRSASGALLNQNAVKITPDSNLDKKFLYYLLKGPDFKDYIIGTAQGAASQASITLSSIKSFQYQLPSQIEVQRKIASVLSTYDDLIENNNRRIKILEEMAQNLYREWFVKFRFPGHENVKMVDSELGKIPDGWELVPLGEALELAYGKALKKDDRIQGNISVYGSSGVVGYHNNALVKGPGIIVGRKGNVGSVHWSVNDFYPIDTVFYVKTNLPLYYVFYNLQYQNFINSDAAVPGLNRNQAYTLPFIIPRDQCLRKFSEFAGRIFNMLSMLKQKNAILRKTRDLLLPKLISGTLDVSELEIEIKEEAA